MYQCSRKVTQSSPRVRVTVLFEDKLRAMYDLSSIVLLSCLFVLHKMLFLFQFHDSGVGCCNVGVLFQKTNKNSTTWEGATDFQRTKFRK